MTKASLPRQRLLRLDEPESCLLIYAPFAVEKDSFAVANPRLYFGFLGLRCGEAFPSQRQTLHLISCITLLYFPSNLVKHEKIGD